MKDKPSIGAWLFWCLFALPFAGVGTFMLYLAGDTVLTYLLQQSWQKTPAKIISLTLEVKRGQKSTTYLAKGSFEYTYKNKTYQSNTLSQYQKADNIGSYQQRLYAKLKPFFQKKQQYYCFVNPRNPAKAVIDRHLRIESLGFYAIFILAFGGFGYTFMIISIKSYLKEVKTYQLSEVFPEEPWQTKPEWSDGAIHANSKGITTVLIIAAVLWNLITGPILIFLPQEIKQGNNAALITLIFPIVGLILIILAAYRFRRWKKFGESTFLMQTFPGVIGGRLEGTVETTVNIKPEDGFHLKLENIKRITTGSGKNRTTTDKVLWQDEKTMSKELMDYDLTMSAIPVSFNIPYKTTQTDSDKDVSWRLTATAKVPGVDYKSKFEVPVFKTADSDPDFDITQEDNSFKDLESKIDPAQALKQARIKINESMNGSTITFPMLQNIGAIFMLFIFTLIWTGASVFLFVAKAPIIFLVIWPLFNVLLIIGLFNMIFVKMTLSLEDDFIRVKGGLLGLTSRNDIETSEIDSFVLGMGTQAGSKIYHKVYAKTHSGKKILLAKGLTKALAKQFIEYIKTTSGITDADVSESNPFERLR
jgi:hypothetical protein